MNKILYISYDGMTDPLGQSQVLPYLVYLSEKGYQFTILSFEKKNRFQSERKCIEEITDHAGIRWVPLFFSKSPPILSKIYDRWRMKKKALQLQRQFSFDMIHCRSYPAAEMGLLLKKKAHTKFLFDMRGFWADEKVDNGQWNQKNPLFRYIYRFYKKKEKQFLLQAGAVVSLTEAAKKEILSKPDYKNIKIDVIPCCTDLDHFDYKKIDAEAQNVLRQRLGINHEQKVLSYLGSVGGWYMTDEMFSFFKRLLLVHPEFVMLILTKDDPGKVKAEAKKTGIPENKIIVTYSVREQLPVFISLSSCSLFFIRPTFSKIASSPTKHGELMGMGIPVICNDIGDTGDIINTTKTGLVVKKFEEKEYDKVIKQLPELLSMNKENIRQAAFQYFDLEKGAGQYSQIYQRILQE